MQIQRLNRTDDEKVYVIAKNVNATTATTGFGLRWVGGAAAEVVSTGANAAVFCADSTMAQFAGLAAEDIAVNAYGRCVAYGLASVAYSAIADVTIGVEGIAKAILKGGAVAGTFVSAGVPQASSVAMFKYLYVVATTGISGGQPIGSAFVRGL
jgi:hypothetical protein